MPSRSALLDAPRAILRVEAWNVGEPPQPPSGIATNDDKMLYQYVRPLEALPCRYDCGAPWSKSGRISTSEALSMSDVMRRRKQGAAG